MNTVRTISLSDFLRRENNNLDLFRIIAALMVIVGHSYVLFPSAGEEDLIRKLTGFTYSGALAVKIFFFISGLVVTNSLIQNASFKHFVISRFLRVFPALIFVCLVTYLIVGPLVTTLPVYDYFNAPQSFGYFKDNILLNTQYDLPGVFSTNQYPRAVNGSLWTLPSEMGCYLFLLGIFSIGLFKSRLAGGIILGTVIIESLLPQRIFTYWIDSNPEVLPLPAFFSLGALLAINQDRLTISFLQTAGFWFIYYVLSHTRFAEFFFCIFIFSLTLNLSASKFLMRLKIKNDISYGIYLWGFLVQQVVQNYMTGQTVYLKMFISGVVSILIAYVSWHLIEKNAIRLGKYSTQKLNLYRAK